MSFFDTLPGLVKVGIVFAMVLYAIHRKLSLGNAFMVGCLFLSFFFNLSPAATVRSVFYAVLYPKTLCLAVIVGLILVLSHSMEMAGQMRRLLQKFRGLISNTRLNLVIFPALIGLLPMPGGAIFSAPMVKEMGISSHLSQDRLSFINYWFRHIWEYWWPMYPGVLLATLMADLNLVLFVAVLFPFTVMAVFLGRSAITPLENSKKTTADPRPPVMPFVRELLPIVIVIIPGLGMGTVFSIVMPWLSIGNELGLMISLCLACGWVWRENHFSATEVRKMLMSRSTCKMVYMVFAILIFKGILQDSHAVDSISGELVAWRIPLVLISMILPFLVGMITGITIAFVGATFPILIPLVFSQGEAGFMIGYVMLALVSGFTGVLLSPLHLCFILSNEYFETPPGPVYRLLWMPCAGLLFLGMAYFWILYGLYRWMG